MENLRCTKCTKEFTLRRNLTRHLKAAHDNQERIKCDSCSSEFTYKHDMEKHRRLFHMKRPAQEDLTAPNTTTPRGNEGK